MTDIKRDEIIPPWLATIQEAVERHLKKPDGFFDMDSVLADIKTVFAPFLASMDLPGLADEVAARHTRPMARTMNRRRKTNLLKFSKRPSPSRRACSNTIECPPAFTTKGL